MAISKINTLILNLVSGLKVAMPQASLAEVVMQRTMSPAPADQPWLMGFLAWRGEQVPVIDPGLMCGQSLPEETPILRYGVLYGLEHIVGIEYYAFALTGVPHAVRLGAEDISSFNDERFSDCPAIAGTAMIEGQSVVIPNFPHLERSLEQQLVRL